MTTKRERIIARIARLNIKIETWETALESIVEGENKEYWYSEADGSQRATKLSPKEIEEMLEGYYETVERLHRKLRGAGLTAVRVDR